MLQWSWGGQHYRGRVPYLPSSNGSAASPFSLNFGFWGLPPIFPHSLAILGYFRRRATCPFFPISTKKDRPLLRRQESPPLRAASSTVIAIFCLPAPTCVGFWINYKLAVVDEPHFLTRSNNKVRSQWFANRYDETPVANYCD